MTAKPPSAKPRAFRLDDKRIIYAEPLPGTAKQRDSVLVEEQEDAFAATSEPAMARDGEAAVQAAEKLGVLQRSLVSWGGLFASALSGLVALTLGLWLTQLVDGLFARWVALGWIGIVLAGSLGLALVVLLAREVYGILRQRRIARLHIALADAHRTDDRDHARNLVDQLSSLYVRRPETAAARSRLAAYAGEIIDGRDLIDIAERELIHRLDVEASREIAAAAKRVSLVTAISPRAIFGVIFVLAAVVRLMRRIAEIYGGRPGLFGFLKLARSVGTHLAITGGMAAGDSLIQQLVGHGIAARISARLGEGVLNGLLTARVGLSAMAVCRPMPFAVESPPGVKDVAPFLFADKKG